MYFFTFSLIRNKIKFQIEISATKAENKMTKKPTIDTIFSFPFNFD